MVSQVKLRKMQEVPNFVGEKNVDGSDHYPTSDDGTTGTALSFDESKAGEMPIDTDALPADQDPDITRERPDADDGDAAMLALTGAAALEAEHQQKAAAEHRAEAARHPNTPQAQFHLAQEQRHTTAQVAYEKQELAADEQSPTAPPAPVDPTPEGGEAPISESEAAHERMESLRREKPDLVASVGDGAIDLEPEFEDFTERPMYSSELAGGQPEEAPFGIPAMASAPLAYGTQEGDHTPESKGDFAEATAAHHEHLQSLGDANIAHANFLKAEGKVGELRAKGEPTAMAEKQAGWSQQLEERAYGLASQAQRIEDGERWHAREDLGAELAHQQRESGAHLKHERHKRAEHSLENVLAANEIVESAGPENRRDLPEQVRQAQGNTEAPVEAAERREDYFEQTPLQDAAAALHATQSGTPPSSTVTPAPEVAEPAEAAAPPPRERKAVPAAGMAPVAVHTPVPVVPSSAPVKQPQAQHHEAAPQEQAHAAPEQPSGEAPSAIDLAQQGVVQPAPLPENVTTQSADGVTSYVFITPPEAVALGYEGQINLGVDDGSGGGDVGEQAWALAAEMEAAIAQARRNENGGEAEEFDEVAGPEPVVDVNGKMTNKPLDPHEQDVELRREEAEAIQKRRNAAIREEIKPDSDFGDDLGGARDRARAVEQAPDFMVAEAVVEDEPQRAPEPEAPSPEL